MKFIDTTMTRQFAVFGKYAAIDDQAIYYLSASDTLDKYDIRLDKVQLSQKILGPGDSMIDLVAKNKCLYMLYQTAIGGLNMNVLNSDLEELVTLSSRNL